MPADRSSPSPDDLEPLPAGRHGAQHPGLPRRGHAGRRRSRRRAGRHGRPGHARPRRATDLLLPSRTPRSPLAGARPPQRPAHPRERPRPRWLSRSSGHAHPVGPPRVARPRGLRVLRRDPRHRRHAAQLRAPRRPTGDEAGRQRRVPLDHFRSPEHHLNRGFLQRSVEHANACHQDELRRAVSTTSGTRLSEVVGVSSHRPDAGSGGGAVGRPARLALPRARVPRAARNTEELGELLRRELHAGLC